MTKSFLLNNDGRVIVYSDIDARARQEVDTQVEISLDERLPVAMDPYIEQAETARDKSQAWSQSPTPPDPDDPTSKSAKTWAGEAEGHAGDAQDAQAAAKAAEQGAKDYRDEAALAASVAASGAHYYDTIAAGRAAVADGETFGVLAGGSDNLPRPTLFRRDTSSTQTEIVDLASGVAVDAAMADATTDTRRETETLTNAGEKAWPVPFDPAKATSAGTVTASAAKTLFDDVRAATIAMQLGGTGMVSTVQLDTAPLVAGEVVRVEGRLVSTNTTPYFGLVFGASDNLVGMGWRTTGAVGKFTPPSATVGSITHSASIPTFEIGDNIAVDARVMGGTEGDWAVRFYVEKNGVRSGPVDLPGVTSLAGVWSVGRGINTMTDIRVSRYRAPRFIADFWPSAGDAVLYVSTTGSDTNSGRSSGSALATVNEAISRAAPGAIIEVAGGEYRQVINTAVTGDIWIRAAANQRAVFLGSSALVVTKTDGYSQVYQAPLAAKPTGMGSGRGEPMLFEWGVPSKLIAASDVHPLQRGESHRLPYTEMLEAVSIAVLDTEPGRGKWFWDAGVIYFAASDGGDATLGRYEARGARGGIQVASGTIRLTRIDQYFAANNGMQFRGCLGVIREDCRSMGNFRNGFSDDCAFVRTYRDEAGGNGNDGVNGTPPDYAATGNRDVVASAVYFDPWCHDNYDDGISFHNRGEGSQFGGLYEYNRKAGVIHVNGAAFSVFNGLARGQINGFYVDAADTDRANNAMVLHGCIAEDNGYNYRAGVGSKLIAHDCVSDGGTTAGYAGTDGGQVVARNCRDSGSLAGKTGDVVVINDTALA